MDADANGDATGESKDESGENGAKTGTSKSGDGEGELTKNVFYVCLFVTEEIPIKVSWWAPDKKARPSPYSSVLNS